MNVMKKNHARNGKRFDEEFRREAVALLERGRSATQLARELGVSTWSLCQWKKRYGTQGAGAQGRSGSTAVKGTAGDLAPTDEVLRLRAELHAVSRQRDILKKALTIMGQDSLPGSN
jgi:transposase-like protein